MQQEVQLAFFLSKYASVRYTEIFFKGKKYFLKEKKNVI